MSDRQLRASLAATVVALMAMGSGGCMKNAALTPGRMGEVYRVSEVEWPTTNVQPLEVGGHQFPSRLVLTREPSDFAAAMNLSSAPDRFRSGQATLDLELSDNMAGAMADLLREAAGRLKAWQESAEEYPTAGGREKWAADMAGVLGLVYRLSRGPASADPRESAGGESMAAALAPMIRSAVAYGGRQAGEPVSAEEVFDVSEHEGLPLRYLLEGAFRMARLYMPREAPAEVKKVFAKGPPTALGVEAVLRQKLLELRSKAEEGPRPPESKAVERYLKLVPGMVRSMARLVEQWPKFYLVSVAVGEINGDEALSLVLDVRPGETVRMDGVHSMAPVLAIRGRTRVTFWTTGDDALPEVLHVRFENERGGQVAILFESWIYGVASALTFPIENWAIDEVTAWQTEPGRHEQTTTVAMLLSATGGKLGEDHRRAIRVERRRKLEVTTTGERVDRKVRHDTRFEYFRPDRMWYYDRTSYERLPKPNWAIAEDGRP